ncbi:MAG: MJ1477/TM1410 family putative glycoside hydrolase [Planctomycetota bacterium]|jgi:cysteinyl-tRNA synthetase
MSRVRLYAVVAALLCATVAAIENRADLSGVGSFAIQLQSADPDALATSGYDLIVTDYSSDGSDAGAYTAAEIAGIQDAGARILGYLPVGELSDFRFYWKPKWRVGRPNFIGSENENWPGAYRAKYWKKGFWDKVVRPHLDRILDSGFDGVFLDTIDSYWYWYTQGEDPVVSADRMAKLVRKTAEYARDIAGEGFIVVANNGLAMVDDASTTWRDHYLADIDGVNVESLFYNYWSTADQTYRLAKIDQYDAAGKRIFNIEYIASSLHDEYSDTLAGQGVEILGYPAAPDAALDELIPK